MKKTKIIAIMLVLALAVGIFAACGDDTEKKNLQTQLEAANKRIEDLEDDLEEANVYKPNKFIDWVEDDSGTWRTIVNGAFKTDAASRPTDDQINQILHYASLAPTSGGKTDYYLVAVTDPEEQLEIIGTTYGEATSEGTVTILVLSDRLYDAATRADGGTVPVQPDRGYYNVGIVSGYLNTAAIALGYGTHFFMTVALPKDNGQFDSGSKGFDVDKYVEGLQYTNGNTGEVVNVTGNLKFVAAIVIGKPDTSLETSVTEHNYPDNWSVWAPPQEA